MKRRRRPCPGKVKHPTELGARIHRRLIRRQNKRRGIFTPGKTLAVYFCPTCQAWHVGNERDPLTPPAS
jgi:hypothetical protein